MITGQTVKNTYQGDGVNREFTITFEFTDSSQIKFKVNGEAVETNFALNTVAKTLTYPTVASELPALTSYDEITIYRDTPVTQNIDFVNGGILNAEMIERGLDKLTMIAQEGTNTKVNGYKVVTAIEETATDKELVTAKAIYDSIEGIHSGTEEFKNKIIDADNNTIKDLTTSNFKSGVIVTSIGSAGSDTAIPTEKATRDALRDALNASIPTGVILPYGGSVIPAGFLGCDGSAISRTNYAKLFTEIGTTYGAGDGSTTFNLPDFTDKTFWGGTPSNVGTVKSAGLPNINGSLNNVAWMANRNIGGAFYQLDYAPSGITDTAGPNGGGWNIIFDASLSNPIYGNSTTVQPPAIQVPFIIKY